MDDFKGSKCIVCGNAFVENDDIVVCPDCGTPYHRGCYKTVGKCVNFALHESGDAWKPDIGVAENPLTDTLCSRCGKQNTETSLFCEACGFPLQSFIKTEKPLRGGNEAVHDTTNDNLFLHPQFVNYSDPLCGFNPDEDFDGVKLSEIADYVDRNTHYYLPIFKSFKTFGRYFSWNFIAFLFPELFFAHRKMIAAALGALFLRLVVMIPDFIYIYTTLAADGLSETATRIDITGSSFRTFAVIFVVADYLRMWYFSTNANKMYYKKVIREIKQCKVDLSIDELESPLPVGTVDEYHGEALAIRLHKKGGTSALWLSLFTCLLLLPLAATMLFSIFNRFFNI
jgi:ribosomal protein L37E